MLVRIKRKRREISRSHRSKNEGRRSCFSSGVASFPRVEAEKRPRALCPVGVINYCLSPKGNTGDNLRAVVMHNDEEQPHLHFFVCSDTEVNAKALHYGHKAKEFHSSIQGVPRRLSRPSRDPLRNGPPRAKEATPDAQSGRHKKEHAMKVAAAESAVLDSAAQRGERSEAESER